MRLATFIAVFLPGIHARATLDLGAWAGKYSHDTETNGHMLFQVPAVQAALSHLLIKQDLKRLTETYSVSSPVSLIEGFFIVPQCMPHCCLCEHAMLVIDLRRGVFHVGFFKRESEKVTIPWFSSEGEFQALPNEIQDEFYYSHNPKYCQTRRWSQPLDVVMCTFSL